MIIDLCLFLKSFVLCQTRQCIGSSSFISLVNQSHVIRDLQWSFLSFLSKVKKKKKKENNMPAIHTLLPSQQLGWQTQLSPLMRRSLLVLVQLSNFHSAS